MLGSTMLCVSACGIFDNHAYVRATTALPCRLSLHRAARKLRARRAAYTDAPSATCCPVLQLESPWLACLRRASYCVQGSRACNSECSGPSMKSLEIILVMCSWEAGGGHACGPSRGAGQAPQPVRGPQGRQPGGPAPQDQRLGLPPGPDRDRQHSERIWVYIGWVPAGCGRQGMGPA